MNDDGASEKKAERVWWHGSPDKNITEWNPDKTKRGVYGRGIYVTRRRDLAEKYAGKEGRVYPVHVDTTRSLHLTTSEGQKEYKDLSEKELRAKYDVLRAPGESVVLNAKAIRHAEDPAKSEGDKPEDAKASPPINKRGDTFAPKERK